jgi:serine/threonine-protein kinase 24/25/MST4
MEGVSEPSSFWDTSQLHTHNDAVLILLCSADKESGKIVAIKLIDLESSDDDISEIQAEIAHLSTCDSDHITRYYGSFVRGWRLWIVMEYLAGGSCLDLVSSSLAQ